MSPARPPYTGDEGLTPFTCHDTHATGDNKAHTRQHGQRRQGKARHLIASHRNASQRIAMHRDGTQRIATHTCAPPPRAKASHTKQQGVKVCAAIGAVP